MRNKVIITVMTIVAFVLVIAMMANLHNLFLLIQPDNPLQGDHNE
jgi:hypothetical protein